jgi:pyrroloquinoline quinone (PQQ) biosynthesis protein C
MNDLVAALDREANLLIESLEEHPVARTLFDGTISADHYAAYLNQTQHYVGVACELLRASGERLAASGQHQCLAQLLLEKSTEEDGHDAWARADLRALGREDAGTGPNLAVQAYVYGHRYEAHTGSGAAFLGTAYVLEALSARRAVRAAQSLVAERRIPGIERAVTFLRAHGDADEGHIAALAATLRGFTDPRDQDAILHSARSTRRLFPGFFPSRP